MKLDEEEKHASLRFIIATTVVCSTRTPTHGSPLWKLQESGEPVFNTATVTKEATVMMGLFSREGAARQFHHWVSITEVLTQTGWCYLLHTKAFPLLLPDRWNMDR